MPQRWSEYDRLAKTTPGGIGIHAVVLDIDIGPLLQVQKLINSVHFARAKGYAAPLDRARTRTDEPDRRRQRPRHGDDAGGVARPRADREFLPAVGL